MPIYEYECHHHGLFEELRPMQRSAESAPCPDCAAASPRVLSATRTSLVPRAVSVAHARNEKSQHSPEVRARAHPHDHAHPRGHAHSHGQQPRPTAARVYRGKRPWVIEHG